ncbi:membrane lipoprotein lipid attachment site-containing protein [Candidatus Woesearchaeota archaeon]|nr:membrane lipoprotein lipid attachment site-containing protein [Candidatus Woesearchaeota archaeon]
MKRVIFIICSLFLLTACSSPPKAINTFTVNHSVFVLSSGGGGGMDFTYRVEKGEKFHVSLKS